MAGEVLPWGAGTELAEDQGVLNTLAEVSPTALPFVVMDLGTGDDDLARSHGEIIAGRYRIGELIGEGGMATVHGASHVVTGRRLAVKFLRQALCMNSDLLARFEREARVVGVLESENVVSVIDFGYTRGGAPYTVMELLSGENLAERLVREGLLTVPVAVDIAIQACRGLAAAHVAGIVHRDIKPENLFLCRHSDGTTLVKVFDFGIATLTREFRHGAEPAAASQRRPHVRTRPGSKPNIDIDVDANSILGTPNYMSPEQMKGGNDADHRCDIYSLGGILFEMLTGERPHPGDSSAEVIAHVLTQEPTRIEALRSTLPPGLAAIVHRTLAFDPNQRFDSALALAAALLPFAGSTRAIEIWSDPPPAENTPVAAAQDICLINQKTMARWARDEIITLHPEAALAILDGALAREPPGSGRQELIALQEEAWFAAFPA